MKRSNWLDFTPLLDVFLLLLFVVLISWQTDLAQVRESTSHEVDQYKEKVTALALERDRLSDLLDREGMEEIEDRLKYDHLKEQIGQLDLSIRNRENRLFVGGEKTSIVLSFLPHRRLEQIRQVETFLLGEMQKTDKDLWLVTLKADEATYRFAYLIVKEAVDALVQSRKPVPVYVLELNHFQ